MEQGIQTHVTEKNKYENITSIFRNWQFIKMFKDRKINDMKFAKKLVQKIQIEFSHFSDRTISLKFFYFIC